MPFILISLIFALISCQKDMSYAVTEPSLKTKASSSSYYYNNYSSSYKSVYSSSYYTYPSSSSYRVSSSSALTSRSMTITLTDACADNSYIQYRVFDVTNNLYLLGSASTAYSISSNSTTTKTFTCYTGSTVCVGAYSISGSWGVGLDNSISYSGSLCVPCGNTINQNLVCN